ncbi:glutamyl-tRNA reductase [Butyricicoccus sp.]|uniref:glutamyl-tRNA reductase n=1 Tax=Butyricicoccus sp. TaxID=2049021 RepID=UPI003D7E741B
MSICMAGIDWENANMDKREAFSFTGSQVEHLCQTIAQSSGAEGCVLLSTCNRTELYLSGEEDLQPDALLCQAAQVQGAEQLFTVRRGRDAERHLMRVSCGLCSQILGEDQIVSQVKRAYAIAHDAQTTDAALSQLFRLAATAGKKSRTQVRLSAAPLSVAGQAVALIEEKLGSLSGTRALVIGNGEMGRLASSLLAAKGCQVTVTLRSYRHGQTIVPAGCRTIAYDERMSLIPQCDILLSATTSPHYTVTRADLEDMEQIPYVVCDLSMPRDIDPAIRHMTGVCTFFDMDSMGGRDAHVNTEDRQQVEDIIEEQMQEFDRWKTYRRALPRMEELSVLLAERIAGDYDFSVLTETEDEETAEKMETAARLAADKAVHWLLTGMQKELTDAALDACREAILRKAPQLRDRSII